MTTPISVVTTSTIKQKCPKCLAACDREIIESINIGRMFTPMFCHNCRESWSWIFEHGDFRDMGRHLEYHAIVSVGGREIVVTNAREECISEFERASGVRLIESADIERWGIGDLIDYGKLKYFIGHSRRRRYRLTDVMRAVPRGRLCEVCGRRTYSKGSFCSEVCRLSNRDTYVYVIEAAETNLVKIGYTNDFVARINDLSRNMAQDCVVHSVLIGDRNSERRLHSRFAKERIHGEWFKKSEDMCSWIAECRDRTLTPSTLLPYGHYLKRVRVVKNIMSALIGGDWLSSDAEPKRTQRERLKLFCKEMNRRGRRHG